MKVVGCVFNRKSSGHPEALMKHSRLIRKNDNKIWARGGVTISKDKTVNSFTIRSVHFYDLKVFTRARKINLSIFNRTTFIKCKSLHKFNMQNTL